MADRMKEYNRGRDGRRLCAHQERRRYEADRDLSPYHHDGKGKRLPDPPVLPEEKLVAEPGEDIGGRV